MSFWPFKRKQRVETAHESAAMEVLKILVNQNATAQRDLKKVLDVVEKNNKELTTTKQAVENLDEVLTRKAQDHEPDAHHGPRDTNLVKAEQAEINIAEAKKVEIREAEVEVKDRKPKRKEKKDAGS